MYQPTNLDRSASIRSSTRSTRGLRLAAWAAELFAGAVRSQALAELGFIVVEIDGMGTPWRSKKFHDPTTATWPTTRFPTRWQA